MSGTCGSGILDKIGCYFDNLFNEFVEFFTELPIKILDLFLDGLSAVINAIPAPEFMTNYSLNNYIPSEVSYFLVQSQFGLCLTIIGAGVTFYLLRRLLTLGIW